MKMITALVVFCIIAAASAQGRPAYICEVVLDNFCPTNAATCANDPSLTFGNTAYGFENFNLVSFGNMFSPSGDVEGRTAVKGNVDLNAYSIGYQLRTAGVTANSPSLPYTMVVGGDAKWHGGSVHPDGSGIPYLGPKEYIFIGGDFTNADASLQVDRTGSCNGNAGCLDAQFNAAQAYYNDLSAAFGALANTATYNLAPWGTITLNCASLATNQYVISISPADFSTITFWETTTCNPASGLIVNIVGTGSTVKFAGATQNIFANQKVLYNVVPQQSNTPSVRVEVGVNGNLLAPSSNYNQPGMGVFIGQVIVANVQEVLQINLITCAAPPSNNHNGSTTHLCPAWEAQCAGLDLVFGGQTYSFRDMNAVSFGSFVANTGDIQGRLAVRQDCSFGAGYTVGYELKTAGNVPDRSLPYSLVCGRDSTWISGSIHPDGSGVPYPGNQENAFIGRTFTASDDLTARRTGSCNGVDGCLDATFNAAKTCYTGYSDAMANTADNVAKTIEWSGLSITCNDASATDYYVSLTASEFASFTYTTVGNCNYQARWYINIRGTEDITISGGSFPGIQGGVVYNVIGCGRTITVKDTELRGHLLAPCSTLNQVNGLITGKVVAGDITFSLQINRENTCPAPVTVQVPVVVASIGNNNLASFSNNFLIAGDNVDGNEVKAYRGDNDYSFVASTKGWTEHQVIYVATNSLDARTQTVDKSGASVVAMSVAFVAFVALAF